MPSNAQRTAKEEEVAFVRERFERAVSSVFLDFRGVTVEQITDLRARFRDKGIDYRVVKNNLVKKALEGTAHAGNEKLFSSLTGMTGIAWSYEDPSAAAKVIKDFRKANDKNEKLGLKFGLLEGQIFEGEAVESQLATLPGKDEIRGMLLATLLAPMQTLVRQLNAPGQNLSYVLDAKRRKDGGEEG